MHDRIRICRVSVDCANAATRAKTGSIGKHSEDAAALDAPYERARVEGVL